MVKSFYAEHMGEFSTFAWRRVRAPRAIRHTHTTPEIATLLKHIPIDTCVGNDRADSVTTGQSYCVGNVWWIDTLGHCEGGVTTVKYYI